MHFPFTLAMPRASLRNRLSGGVVAIVFVATFGVATAALYLVKDRAQAAIGQEQFARVSSIADAIDQKFVSRRILLRSSAESIEAQGLSDGPALQDFLDRRPTLMESFDNLWLLDLQGNLAADVRGRTRVGQLNLHDRPYFIDTLASGVGLIAQPTLNRTTGKPEVVMTQPVRDAAGQVRWVLTGAIHLQQQNFLGDLAEVRFGNTGYLFILNTAGIVIDHPQKARILQRADAAGGSYAVADKALAGFEGTTEARSRAGVDGLYSFRRLRQTNWIVGGIYPRAEAFASIDAIGRAALFIALALALFAGALALYVMRRQLRPLVAFHHRMLAAYDAKAHVPAGRDYPQDEIGDVARTFDALMLQRQAAQESLQASEQHLRQVLAHAGDAFVAIDRYGVIIEWNHQAEQTFGWSRAEAVGQPMAELIIPAELRGRHELGMRSFVYSGGGPVVNKRIELPALHRDGRTIPVELSVASVRVGDHFVANAFLRDITAAKQLEEQLRSVARIDTLTGLHNRLAFNEMLPVALARARRTGQQLAIMYLDIDRFKGINDTLGHAGGDAVLVEFAARLRASVRTTDVVARLAGDEFVVILENLDKPNTVADIARKVVAQVAAPTFDVEGRPLAVTTSIGIVCNRPSDSTATVDELVARADAALYGAKAAGRNTFQFAVGEEEGA